ncbi:helix-turn-helix domain-containing protein [Glacieibacterium megasporae]|uniref:helix-turn-helix domain-containing protein n=1 Tax=Glacieibacterium megasporae TaxID=2835787 RepID=UPI001C1E6F3E|nr:helix-turn-helix transcriptional regulator [Polymorphobacter megasporae]UAJ09562.1 helix-turn-helix domain-containing protein [Polymorphobacter megasporae]
MISSDDDAVAAAAALARVSGGEKTMPAEVLALMLDDGLSPLAAWRRYRGLSQAALAEMAAISQVWVGRIEAGGGYGSPATRRKLAAALGVEVWALDDPDAGGEGAAKRAT